MALKCFSCFLFILASKPVAVELVGRNVKVSPDTGIFITMNPGYAGRRNLPDNLKQLFRSLAMTKPDRLLIAEVMLYSQGFRMAEKLASKVVPFFKLVYYIYSFIQMFFVVFLLLNVIKNILLVCVMNSYPIKVTMILVCVH